MTPVKPNPALADASEILEVVRHFVTFANTLATQRTALQHSGKTSLAQAHLLALDEQRLRSMTDWLSLYASQLVFASIDETQERLLRSLGDAERIARDLKKAESVAQLTADVIALGTAIVEQSPAAIVAALAALRKQVAHAQNGGAGTN